MKRLAAPPETLDVPANPWYTPVVALLGVGSFASFVPVSKKGTRKWGPSAEGMRWRAVGLAVGITIFRLCWRALSPECSCRPR